MNASAALLWTIAIIAVNFIVGASVWAACDNEQQDYLAWFKSCPPRIAWLAQPLVLFCWPAALWMRFFNQAPP